MEKPVYFKSAKNCGVILCSSCDLAVNKCTYPPNVKALCPRCHTPLYNMPYCAINGMFALCLSALILYFPAMFYPVLKIEFLGSIRSTTAYEGAMAVINQDYWIVGVAVLLSAVVAPGLLICSILSQIIIIKTALLKTKAGKAVLVFLLKVQGILTQTSMLEIYVISFLVSAFQLSDFATIKFGIGTFCFTMLFLITMFLLREYDLEHMWSFLGNKDEE